MGGIKANIAFTDPPYNVAFGEHGGASKPGNQRTIRNDHLGEGFYDFLLVACQNILAHTDGAVYISMACAELHTLQRAFVNAGGHWSTFIIWAKNTFTLGRSDYQRQYEPILFGWREGERSPLVRRPGPRRCLEVRQAHGKPIAPHHQARALGPTGGREQ